MPQIELEHVTKSYTDADGRPVSALADVTLAVERGELLALAGPSGSGKTTLLRLVAGLEAPTAGKIRVGGQPIGSISPRERPIGMVFQTTALFPEMTVADNLAFGLKVRGAASSEIRTRVGEAVEVLGLAGCLRRKPAALSGGERQRVALGRALVRRPDVLLLDEPLSAVDPQLRTQLRGLVRDLHARIGAATVYVTHDHAEAMGLGHRLAVLRAGILEQTGSPSEVYNDPKTLFMAGFLGSRPINLFRGDLQFTAGGARFREASGAFELSLDAAMLPAAGSPRSVILGIRSEHVLPVAPGDTTPAPGCSTITGRVRTLETTGPETYLTLNLGGVDCVVRSNAPNQPGPGSEVKVRFDASAVRLFDPATGRKLGPGA